MRLPRWFGAVALLLLMAFGIGYCNAAQREAAAMALADAAAERSDSLRGVLGQVQARNAALAAASDSTRAALDSALIQLRTVERSADLRARAADAEAALANRQVDSLSAVLLADSTIRARAGTVRDLQALTRAAVEGMQAERRARMAVEDALEATTASLDAALVRVDALQGEVQGLKDAAAVEARLRASLEDEIRNLRAARSPGFWQRTKEAATPVAVAGVTGAVLCLFLCPDG